MKDLTTEQYRLIYDQPVYPKNMYLDRAPYTHEEYREQVLEPNIERLRGAGGLRGAGRGRGHRRTAAIRERVPRGVGQRKLTYAATFVPHPPSMPRPSMLPFNQAERSASVGDSRAARRAGYSPATPPTHTATSTPPASATTGTAAVQPSELA